jgi:acyl carrier protein
MSKAEVAEVLTSALALRNLPFRAEGRLIDDLGMDSYDVVSLIIEVEAAFNAEFDEEIHVLFAEATMGEICARLAQ